MPTVRVEPAGLSLAVEHGETVMAAAQRLGCQWPTVCHGDASCSVCWMEILEGQEHLAPASDDELETLDLLPRRTRLNRVVRLACRTEPSGDIVVRKDDVGLAAG